MLTPTPALFERPMYQGECIYGEYAIDMGSVQIVLPIDQKRLPKVNTWYRPSATF